MKSLSVTLSLLLLLVASAAYSAPKPSSEREEMSIYEAINKAGYQRMLTQRIAKSYFAVVADISADRYKKHLLGSARMFENNLRELKNYVATDEIKNQFRYVEILWRNYTFIYNDEYSLENAAIILEFNDKILKACNDAVLLLEDFAKTQSTNKDQEAKQGQDQFSVIINKAGRQRMLSQRLLLFALAKHINIGEQVTLDQKSAEALSLYQVSNEILMNFEGNSDQIDKELFSVGERWGAVETLIQSVSVTPEDKAAQKDSLEKTLKDSELVLFSLDEIVFLYERIAESK